MEQNMFTGEQLEILRKGFQEHDFTQAVPLNPAYEDMTPKQAAAFVTLKKRIMDYAKANLPTLDIKRKPGNFTGDFPVNLLLEADSAYIANEAVNILGDAQRTQDAINQFFDMFGGLVDQVIFVYCTRKNKTPDELTDEDEQRIMERVIQVVNETLLETVMLGQQLPEINEIAHKFQTHEDFGDKRNPDAINFHNKWTHAKTKIGEMLSLESLDESIPASGNTDADYNLLRDSICSALDDTDTTIFNLLEDGKTQREIAAVLGYKTPSAVSKRIRAIQKKYEEFTKDDDE